MEINFKKPPARKIRYPPILDYSSRTIASPITSGGSPIPLIHKIGSNYSPVSKGFTINIKSKQINCLPVEGKNTF